MRIFKHPEQMTPGSFWGIKGVKGMWYVEDRQVIGANFKGWNIYHWHASYGMPPVVNPVPELTFKLKTPYMLVQIQHVGGMINAVFLVDGKLVGIQLFESFWDRAFRLIRKSNFPKRAIEYEKLFDKYEVETVKKELGLK